jgi:N-acetylmuramoyl-L-alanine amidase
MAARSPPPQPGRFFLPSSLLFPAISLQNYIMKRVILFLLVWPLGASAWTILVDPGHGGSDRGAVYSGLKESELTLTIAKKLKNRLAEDPRFKIRLSRQSDRYLGLQERIDMAEAIKADLIVSIHANSAIDIRARGVELFIQDPIAKSEDTLYLAHQESQIISPSGTDNGNELSKSRDIAAILDDLYRQNKFFRSLELSEILKQMWRDQRPNANVNIKQGPFFIISRSHIPAVLVEIGFLSHPKESKQLKDPKYQQQVVDIIHQSLLKYLAPKNSDKYMAVN